jgi:hypothetical protein
MEPSSIMIAASGMSRISWYAVGVGTALLSIAWVYLMLSRRGTTRPVSKCVVLSVGAHLILLGLANLTIWFPTTLGTPSGTGEIHVHWVDEAPQAGDMTDSDASLAQQPSEPDRSELIDPPITPKAEAPSQTDTAASVADAMPPPERPDIEPSDAATVLVEQSVGDNSAEVSTERLSALPPSIPDPNAPHAVAVDADVDADAEQLFTSTESDLAVWDQGPRESPTPGAVSAAAPAVLDPPAPLNVATVDTAAWPDRYAGRTAENRRRLSAARGGSPDTEAAVELALLWLARAQHPYDGHWDNRAWEGGLETRNLGGITHGVKADTAVTGLALLAFFGAGHTHQQGPYQEHVRRGLQFLLQSQSRQTGSLAGDSSHFVAMYGHGIATLALSEAMIMSGDRQLKGPLLRAVDYTVRSQHPVTGGWRYQPGDLGDTSQFGWQLMALVSAEAGGIPIPDRTWEGARRWLDRVALGAAGGLACYTPDRPVPSPSMTAEALFCRSFMRRFPAQATIDEAAEYVARYGTSLEAREDLYFCYYTTLALYQLQDDRWERWNQTLTQHLVNSQQRQGSLTGSWNCNTKWGRVGGRVYTTSMACLCLETYYRYLPVLELAATRGEAIRQR